MTGMTRPPRRPALGLAALAAAAFAVGCDGATEPRGAPLQGTVAQADAFGRRGHVLVVGLGPSGAFGDTAVFDLARADVFVRRPGGALARGRATDVAAGADVRAWTTGVAVLTIPP
ncbi:MAG: hypothetical protein AVDCRST_MAG40-432, partial [uncultured Gemmatimonadaceae bacterium]